MFKWQFGIFFLTLNFNCCSYSGLLFGSIRICFLVSSLNFTFLLFSWAENVWPHCIKSNTPPPSFKFLSNLHTSWAINATDTLVLKACKAQHSVSPCRGDKRILQRNRAFISEPTKNIFRLWTLVVSLSSCPNYVALNCGRWLASLCNIWSISLRHKLLLSTVGVYW